jgi:hypothetical protein
MPFGFPPEQAFSFAGIPRSLLKEGKVLLPHNKRQRKARLFLMHPDKCPDLVGPLPYLIHPPSKLSSTAQWIDFRDRTLLPMMRHRPDDPNLPNFLKQVEEILEWRAITPADKFWRDD